MTKRIGYIDAMRGFTMILVVFSHVLSFSFKGTSQFSYNEVFVTFRMPLFFFLSGFLLFKENLLDSFNKWRSFVLKKFKVQIIPTIIFISIFALSFQRDYVGMWMAQDKAGYWFTFVLFFYFLIFSTIHFSLSKKSTKCNMIVGGLFSIVVYIASLFTLNRNLPGILSFFSVSYFRYYIFFYFGVLFKWKFEAIQKLLDGKELPVITVVVFLFAQLFLHFTTGKHGMIGMIRVGIIMPVVGVLGILLVFLFFRKYQDSFAIEKPMGKMLQYVGKRTLDIYLLHYFLLPYNLGFVGVFFAENNNPILELFIGIGVALLVVGACIIISNIVRTSDVLAELCFGKVISN